MQNEIKSINLWCYNEAKNHDKLYGLYIWQTTSEKYDVVSVNGRRGSQLAFNVLKEGVSKDEAVRKFNSLLREKLSPAKGYKVIFGKVQEADAITPPLIWVNPGSLEAVA